MAYPKELSYDTLRSLGFASVGAAYTAVGTAFTRPVRLLKIVNTTDINILVSTNGTTDHDVVAANGFTLYDLTANKVRDEGAFFRSGLTIFVKREAGAPTSGNVYVTVIAGVPT